MKIASCEDCRCHMLFYIYILYIYCFRCGILFFLCSVYFLFIYIYTLCLYLNRLSWKRVVSIAMLDYWMVGNTLTPPFLVSLGSHWNLPPHQGSMMCKMVTKCNKNMGPKTFLQVPCIMYFQGEEMKDDKVKKSENL